MTADGRQKIIGLIVETAIVARGTVLLFPRWSGRGHLLRRKSMKRFVIALTAVLALVLARPALADEPIILKFSHVVSPDAPKGNAALLFKDLAEKYTNGRVKVEVYPNSSLYKDKEELEALQLGAVQLLAPSISKFGPLGVKEFDIFDLPFLMND